MIGYNCMRKLASILQRSGVNITRKKVSTITRMDPELDYEKAICTLNSLQSNAIAIQHIQERKRRREENVNIKEAWKFLGRVGIGVEEMNKLSVIHIAGTKGKGSSSAMCESILRRHGYSTGLYSSPHLVSATERIRLNGRCISREYFARNFHQMYQQLWQKRESDTDIPGYFMSLTVLALKVFLQEKVDVAVIEVGIGGEYDVTNVVSNVAASGITSLGLEHTAILGNTIEDIAREKGGIMKQGGRAFTVAQPQAAMTVLENIALSRNCTLSVVPEVNTYDWGTNKEPAILTDVPAFKLNVSLAIQLSNAWISQHKMKTSKNAHIYSNEKHLNQICENIRHSVLPCSKNNKRSKGIKKNDKSVNKIINTSKKTLMRHIKNVCDVQVSPATYKGIESCVLPGRCQILKDDAIDYYIDGAHTKESMMVCTEWFKNLSRLSSIRILIFNTTGDRNSETLLRLLHPLNFHVALFVPNIAFDDQNLLKCLDQINLTTNCHETLQKCKENLDIWNNLNEEQKPPGKIVKNSCEILTSVDKAIKYIRATCENNNCDKPQVVITGSLHLVGAALAVLDPELTTSDKSSFQLL